jgi:hypothetical protein
MINTGGVWDYKEQNVYFLAGSPSAFNKQDVCDYYDHILTAVNEIHNADDEQFLLDAVSRGKKVFIDSGVFNLTMQHSRANNISMDKVLALSPTEIDGFDNLFDKYTRIVKEIGDRAWGYIEIDQGGKDNKIKTRDRLHNLGFNPIPVYHPLVDGWDYFDYLAERYDRICLGNVVQAQNETRKRLLATMWERKRKYPNLWIHCLGMTPNEHSNAFPLNSCDSSSWVSTVRWMDMPTRACLKAWDSVEERVFRYDLNDPEKSHKKTIQISANNCKIDLINWRQSILEVEKVLETDHRMPL